MKYTIESSGAFVTSCEIEPSSSGPLDGLRFAVKDLIDVAGYISGCGDPTWRDTTLRLWRMRCAWILCSRRVRGASVKP